MDDAADYAKSQLLLDEPHGSFTLSSAPPHTCADHEIIIEIRAIALNRFDVEQFDAGTAISHWPAVLGVEAAGVVERSGNSVDEFKPGDRVFALFQISEDNRSAAFQSHAAIDASLGCHSPPYTSFPDTASLPLAFIKATKVIQKALASFPPNKQRFFIFGCNSSSGASAIQILRYKFPDAWICGTIYGDDKDELSEDSARMLMMGMTYVIDGGDPLTPPYLTRIAEDPPDFGLVFPHPPECDAELHECIGNPTLFSADDLDGDVPTMIKEASAVESLRSMIRERKYVVPFPAKVVGTGLQSIAELIRDVPQESEKAKHVVRM